MTSPMVKVFIGLVLLVVPLALYVYDLVTPDGVQIGPWNLPMLQALWTVILGSVPPFIALIGLFIVWLELDEWRIEKELKMEEAKAEKEAKKVGRKKK